MTTPDTLYLEIDEEIPSVIEKLKQHPADDVVFVVPVGASLLQSVVNVKLLKRTADKTKKRLAFVTTDPVARHVASQVGIPVFVSPKDRRVVELPRARRATNERDELDLRPTPSRAGGVSVHHYTEGAAADQSSSATELKRALTTGFASHAVPPPVAPRTAQTVSPPSSASPVPASRRRRRTVGLLLLALLTILGATGALAYYYPQALVELTVVTEPYTADLSLTVDSSRQFVAADAVGVLSGDHLEQTAEATSEVTATGTKDLGTKAQGSATLENRLGQGVKLSSGTTLVGSGQTFKTKSDVTIPAATASVDASGAVVVTPGRSETAIEAAAAGEGGNVAAATAFTVQDAGSTVQDKVSASAKGALTGGTSKQVTVVSDDDLAKAKTAAEEQAAKQAGDQASSSIGDKRLLENASRVTIVKQEANAAVGDERSSVSQTVGVKYEAIVFDDVSFRAALTKQVESALGPDRMVVVGSDDASTSAVESADWSAGTFIVTNHVNTRVSPRLDEGTLTSLLKGRSVQEAQRVLKSQSTIARASITIRPSWLPRLPSRAGAIRLTFTQAPANQ